LGAQIAVAQISTFVFRRICKIANSDYELRGLTVCMFVFPSVRKEQLGYHWMDFHKI